MRTISHGNLGLGLKMSSAVVMYIQLQNLDFNAANLNKWHMEVQLRRFFLSVHELMRANHGTVISCSGDSAVVMWRGRNILPACKAALDLQMSPELTTTQVRLTSPRPVTHFLTGNE